MKLLQGVAGHLPHHLWVQFSFIARRTQLEWALGATGQHLFKQACCLWGHLYSYFCWGHKGPAVAAFAWHLSTVSSLLGGESFWFSPDGAQKGLPVGGSP